MLFDCWYIFLHQKLEKLNSKVYLAFRSMVETEEMERMNKVSDTVDILIELLLGKYTREHFR